MSGLGRRRFIQRALAGGLALAAVRAGAAGAAPTGAAPTFRSGAAAAGAPWLDHHGLVLGPGPAGRCDDAKVGVGVVRRERDGGDWLCWYYCRDAAFDAAAPPTLGTGRIALARSRDGRAFERVDGPAGLGAVLAPGGDPTDFDALHLGLTDVTRVGDEWWMWTFGGNRTPRETRVGTFPGIGMLSGLAVSRDGVHWTRRPGRGPGGSLFAQLEPTDVFAAWPNAVHDGERVWLYVTAIDREMTRFRTHVAVSCDGRDWEPRGELRWTRPEPAWQAQGLMTRHVQRNPFGGPRWLMTYTALDGERSRFQRRTVGVATSDDLLTWTPAYDAPVFEPAAAGAWDDGGVAGPQLLVDGGRLHLYYFGFPVPAREREAPKGVGLALADGPEPRGFVRLGAAGA